MKKVVAGLVGAYVLLIVGLLWLFHDVEFDINDVNV